ncbi:MAG: biopolymer transporter ExbD [Alphaproteobacteria bacterium]|nr:biopolymer transporter ExbD [Alphaproteobacteria bacterium]
MGGGDDDAIVDINITPFVDIVLVILIIFMVTATTIAKQAVLVDLPDAASGETATDVSLGIEIDPQGNLYLDGEPATEGILRKRIRDERARVEPGGGKVTALIAADQAIPYGEVMGVMDVVKQEGVAKFALNIDSVPAPAAAQGALPPPADAGSGE